MNHSVVFKKTFIALITGIFLIYAIGGAAIASATISGHQELVQGLVNLMVSLGMTWLMIVGVICLALYCYGVYEAWSDFLAQMSESLSEIFAKRKGAPQTEGFDKLTLREDETQRGHSSDNTKLKEMNQ